MKPKPRRRGLVCVRNGMDDRHLEKGLAKAAFDCDLLARHEGP